MAKEKRSVDDLDAELAALEAELAALEGRKAAPKKKAPAKPAPAPKAAQKPAEVAQADQEPEAAPEEPKRKRGLSLPKPKLTKPKLALPFGKKSASDEPAPAQPETPALVDTESQSPPAIAQAPAIALVPTPEEESGPRREAIPVTDGSHWRAEDGAWVRDVPDTPIPVIRRVLDEDGAIVREESATQADLDEVSGVKTERGIGKILGKTNLKLPGKMPSFGFGRKKE